ncbi:MAG TPA: hypothetical protein VFV38_39320 [Ktedonobacteraceae bacterium]|nr:hypothetical protein [Ktedonobacteraceae bacterium]
MSAPKAHQPTLDSVAPRFLVGEMEQALAFYGQLGFVSSYYDEGFAILERDRITLQFNVSDPTQDPPKGGAVCSIDVTNIEALYHQYLPTGALQSPVQVQSGGMKAFVLCDPSRNLLLFGERVGETMSTEQNGQPTLVKVAPCMLIRDMEQALTFYGQLGFATTSHDEGVAVVKRDGISLHFTVPNPTHKPSEGCRVCYIAVTNIEALYQHYLPTGALRSPIKATDWGTKGFWLCDPFRNLLIFEESIPEGESSMQQGE